MPVDRIPCVVPFCRRSKKATLGVTYFTDTPEWICGDHWRLVPKKARDVKNRSARELRREIGRNPLVAEYWKMPPGSPERLKAVRLWRVHDRIWNRCKRIAIERAGGI